MFATRWRNCNECGLYHAQRHAHIFVRGWNAGELADVLANEVAFYNGIFFTEDCDARGGGRIEGNVEMLTPSITSPMNTPPFARRTGVVEQRQLTIEITCR